MKRKIRFSQGPWKISPAYQDSTEEIEIKSKYIMSIKSGSKVICLPGSESHPEAIGNARLISFAPDMYAMLTELLNIGLRLPMSFEVKVHILLDNIDNVN